jgi:hypothetical protein
MRRQFKLPQGDEEFVNSLGLEWETVTENGNWLIIHNYLIPDGYTSNRVSIGINISSGYPDTKLDMVYVYPALSLCNGKAIGAVAVHNLDGKSWQRWSRHRTSENPWRPGVDDLAGHLTLVSHWFKRELGKASP